MATDVVHPANSTGQSPVVISRDDGGKCWDRDRGRDEYGGILAEIIHQGHVQNHLGNIQTQVAGVGQAVSQGDAATQRHLGELVGRNGVSIERSASDTQRQLCGVESALSREFGATQRQSAELSGSLSRQVADVARELAMQAERQTAQVTLQAERQAAASALAAATNTAAIQAAIAECCCEFRRELAQESNQTRLLVQEQAGKTRELLRDLDKERLQADLAAAQREILALKLGEGRPHGPRG